MRRRWRTDPRWKQIEPVGFTPTGAPIWPSYEQRWRYRSRRTPKPNAVIWYGVHLGLEPGGRPRLVFPPEEGAPQGNITSWVSYRAAFSA